MATRRRKRRRSRGMLPPLALPQLEQRHWDVVGLALVALFAAGALMVVRPLMEHVHPFRTGAACLAAALLLGLAAGSLGLGPGDTARDGFLDAEYLRRHGGLTGEVLFWTSSTLFSEAGSHILFVFLLLAGLLLITNASIAGLMTATRDAATSTGERVRGATRSLHAPATAPLPRGPLPGDPIPGVPREPAGPPEPEDSEPVVRATHVEAPALAAPGRSRDLEGQEEDGPEPQPTDGLGALPAPQGAEDEPVQE